MSEDNKNVGADAAVVALAGSSDTPSATARHTEGPWRIDQHFNEPNRIEVWDERKGGIGLTAMIASVIDLHPRNGLANAHLIATAPESNKANRDALALLRFIRDAEPAAWDRVIANTESHALETWDALKAAIAKAEGRS